jgi:hypothetical protein
MPETPHKVNLTRLVITQTLGFIASSALLTWLWTWSGRSTAEALSKGVQFAIMGHAVAWLAHRQLAKRD